MNSLWSSIFWRKKSSDCINNISIITCKWCNSDKYLVSQLYLYSKIRKKYFQNYDFKRFICCLILGHSFPITTCIELVQVLNIYIFIQPVLINKINKKVYSFFDIVLHMCLVIWIKRSSTSLSLFYYISSAFFPLVIPKNSTDSGEIQPNRLWCTGKDQISFCNMPISFVVQNH